MRTVGIIAIVISFFCLRSGAQESLRHNALVLEKMDGAEVVFMFDKRPVITFDGDNIYVESEGFKASHPLQDVNGYHFDVMTTDISELMSDKKQAPIVRRSGRILEFYNLSDNTEILVFGIDGVPVMRRTGCCTIDLSRQPKGIYIVKVGESTIKIVL